MFSDNFESTAYTWPIARSESKESGVHGRAYGIWMQAKIK